MLFRSGMGQDKAFEPVLDLALDRAALPSWLQYLKGRIQDEGRSDAGECMLKTNPKFILRNHLAQWAIQSAQAGDPQMVQQLLQVLQNPYDEHPMHDDWAGFAPDWAQQLEISCSS